MNVTNKEFLTTIFGDDVDWCHVTDFPYDPSDIPKDKHRFAWMGDYYSRYRMGENTNQYFTISTFYADDEGVARRRKALYRETHCIVLDDVREKLSAAQANKLPTPSWILETSDGSEQWGFILSEPCTDPSQVNNLIDGFIESDLCPQNKDSGMAGTTRYVRLPEGVNSKASKLVNGQPFKCVMQQWNPFSTTTMDKLAEPFNIDIYKARKDERVDGAADIPDHPLLDQVKVKSVLGNGRFDITCPWVDEHTGAEDSGTAIFTNADGSMGFKCHHGNCAEKTNRDLVRKIESNNAGFTNSLAMWTFSRNMDMEVAIPEPVDFIEAAVETPVAAKAVDLSGAFNQVMMTPNGTAEKNKALSEFLKVVDGLPKIDQKHWHKLVCDQMSYTKADFKEVLADLRTQWYDDRLSDCTSFADMVFVGELNMFYSMSKKIFYSPESAQNSYSHEDAEFRKAALQDARVHKVDKIDYAPSLPTLFAMGACSYVNLWSDKNQPKGVAGDASPWLNHFDVIGWGEYRDHVVQWMAYTIQYPEIKINHALIFGGAEGIGKDFIMKPLMQAMADNATTIDGESLVSNFSSYIKGHKLIHINEIELGDHHKSKEAAAKLKRLTSEPPTTLTINEKGIREYEVRNICNVMMATNSTVPVKLQGMSRRLYAMWCSLKIRGDDDNVLPEWLSYWDSMWDWMNNGGLEVVINHLRTIDVSSFKAKEAPPVTEFLRDMVDDSKPQLQLLLEYHINGRLGMFECDILTSSDIVKALRSDDENNDVFKVESKYITANSVGRIMKQMNDFPQVRSSSNRYWLLRNADKYINLKPTEFDKIYKQRHDEVRTSHDYKVVKNVFDDKVSFL